MTLRVAPVSHEAALYAVTRWHYSRSLSSGKAIKLGVWEDEAFIGAVVFGRGANRNMAGRYGLETVEAAELTRVALAGHTAPVTEIVSAALRELGRRNPGLRLVVSYADPAQGHHGGIYQAGNWIYDGTSTPQAQLVVNGRPMHKKSAQSSYGTCEPAELERRLRVPVRWGPVEFKHRYLYPLDRAMRRRVTKLAQPYPAARHAVQASMVTRSGSTGESQVRALGTAPLPTPEQET